ncbi:MAG TPA: RidA family protein [Opitutaceae bacterium]
MKKLPALFLIVISTFTAASAQDDSPEARIAKLGLTLEDAPPAIANYVPAVRAGNLVFLAGQIARDVEGRVITGKVGRDLSELQAAEAGRACTLQLLSALKSEVGELSKVKHVVRVGGFVNCTDDFTRHSQVINGSSDLLVAVFGEAGRHARASVGVNSLPSGAPVEVEMIVELRE